MTGRKMIGMRMTGKRMIGFKMTGRKTIGLMVIGKRMTGQMMNGLRMTGRKMTGKTKTGWISNLMKNKMILNLCKTNPKISSQSSQKLTLCLILILMSHQNKGP